MGYNTDFEGTLYFQHDITVKELKTLYSICGADAREYPEWGMPHLTYIDYVVTAELDGIIWDGSEKSYDMVEKTQLIINLMKKVNSSFELKGELLAQGEELSDRWKLIANGDIVTRQDIVLHGKVISCPHCDAEFIMEE